MSPMAAIADAAPEIETLAEKLVDMADEASARSHHLRMIVMTEALCQSMDRMIKADGPELILPALHMIERNFDYLLRGGDWDRTRSDQS